MPVQIILAYRRGQVHEVLADGPARVTVINYDVRRQGRGDPEPTARIAHNGRTAPAELKQYDATVDPARVAQINNYLEGR